MIVLNLTLWPYGSGIGRSDVLSGTICTTDDGKWHAYQFTDGNGVYHSGRVPKYQSGHRNPFQLLNDITNQILINRPDNRAYKLENDDEPTQRAS